jgi:SAM-dependent methyltransferase
MMAAAREHWQAVHAGKAPTQTSWHRERLDASLRLIAAYAPDRAAPAIDVGGGRSTLVDDLLADGFADVTVLDVSGDALAQARARLLQKGLAASPATTARDALARDAVHFVETDILDAQLPPAHFALWHDRAVFHFLVDASEQAAYVALAARSLRPGGVAIVATFAADGPARCSGLPVARYDADALAARFGDAFACIGTERDLHKTPAGTTQPFTYVALRRLAPNPSRAAHAEH